jgi:hypothetical protein
LSFAFSFGFLLLNDLCLELLIQMIVGLIVALLVTKGTLIN